MRSLSLRIALAIGAAAVIGLMVFDVGFVFWEQDRYAASRSQSMSQLAQQLVVGLKSAPSFTRYEHDARGVKRAVIEDGFMVRYAVGDETNQWGRFPPSIRCPKKSGGQGQFKDGVEFICIRFRTDKKKGLVVVARQMDDTLAHVYSVNQSLIPWLVLAGGLILILGLFFLRRSIIHPLFRLSQLVREQDTLGLCSYGQDNRGLLGTLGSGIIGMNQKIDDDRSRIRHQLSELQSTQEQLIRAERLATVGQLAAGLAHEVGNPLAILQGYVDILNDPELPSAEREQSLDRMKREIDRIHTTLRSLLDYARVTEETSDGGNVWDALNHVQELLTPQKQFSDIEFQFPPPNGSCLVRLGYDSLVQVLLNLLLNAADALDSEGIVRVSFSLDENEAVLMVQDNGPGIEPRVASRLFEPFFTTKAAGEGTGLGLAVCDTIVGTTGGQLKVCVTDKPTDALSGACFELRLPLYLDDEGSQQA